MVPSRKINSACPYFWRRSKLNSACHYLILGCLARPALAATDPGVAVLTYHWVGERPAEFTVLPPRRFRRQMRYLHDHKYHVVPLSAVVGALKAGKPLPEKAVVLTFDDGYRSCWTQVRPVLKQYRFPATFYAYTDYIGTDGDSLSWSQLRRLAHDPLFEVGSHTLTHPDLEKHLCGECEQHYRGWLEREVSGSKRILEKRLGIKVAAFAYPYGAYDSLVVAAAERAGYQSSVTTDEAPLTGKMGIGQSMETLPRQFIDRADTMADFVHKISSRKLDFSLPYPAPRQITDGKPKVSVHLEDAARYRHVQLRLGRDLVPAHFEAATGWLTYTPPQRLPNGTYPVNIAATDAQGQYYSASWLFVARHGASKSR